MRPWPARFEFNQVWSVIDPHGHCRFLRLALADRWWQRLAGLVGQGAPAAGCGLLLEPCGAIHTFGLRHPIDLVFLDASDMALKVVPAVRPMRGSICSGARSVIELRCGEIDRLRFVPGDQWISPAGRSRRVRIHST